jgi:hypothetical protein
MSDRRSKIVLFMIIYEDYKRVNKLYLMPGQWAGASKAG